MRYHLFGGATPVSIHGEPAAYGLLAGLAVLVLAAWALGCGDGCTHYSRLDPQPRVMGQQFDSAVRIEVFCIDHDPFSDHVAPEFKGGIGSGVIIDARHVLTAHHVIDCPYLPDVHVVMSSGARFRVVVEKEWRDSDVARLEIASGSVFGNFAPPPLAQPGPGEGVCAAVSYPTPEGKCGQIVELTDNYCHDGSHAHWCHDFAMTMNVIPGNSGSPLYDTLGNLVGLVTGVAFDPNTMQPTTTAYGHTLPEDVMP